MREAMLAAMLAALTMGCGGGGAVLAVTPLPDGTPPAAGIPEPAGRLAQPSSQP